MRQVTKKGLITIAAAGGVLALSGGAAHADSGAEGNASNSPGVLSGNSVQVPVHVPVNACGNAVSVVGALNPAFGNACANKSGPASHGKPGNHGPAKPGNHGPAKPETRPGGHHGHGGGASAHGDTSNSPGVGSGNNVKVPVHVPVNACGNGVSVVGLLNPVFGNDCDNQSGPSTPDRPGEPHTPPTPGEPHTPPTPVKPQDPGQPHTPPADPGTPPTRAIPNVPEAQTVVQPKATEVLAQTGASGSLGTVIPVGAGLLLAGAVMYRRARSAA